jgi:hypothetical protein
MTTLDDHLREAMLAAMREARAELERPQIDIDS